LLPYLKSGKLAKWFLSRDMADKAEILQAVDMNQSDLELMKAICTVLELEADDDILEELLAQAVVETKAVMEAPTALAQVEEEDDTPSVPVHRIDWSGKDMSNRHFDNEDLSYANLEGTNFTGSSLRGANLTGANLKNAILTNADCTEANFTNADLSECYARGRESLFVSANFTNAKLIKSTFAKYEGGHPNFKDANLTDTDCTEANLSVHFSQCILVRTNFSFANFGEWSVPKKYVGRLSSSKTYPFENVKLTGAIGYKG
jgi:uncharacterized protein YjbI with pentapeptide repeats